MWAGLKGRREKRMYQGDREKRMYQGENAYLCRLLFEVELKWSHKKIIIRLSNREVLGNFYKGSLCEVGEMEANLKWAEEWLEGKKVETAFPLEMFAWERNYRSANRTRWQCTVKRGLLQMGGHFECWWNRDGRERLLLWRRGKWGGKTLIWPGGNQIYTEELAGSRKATSLDKIGKKEEVRAGRDRFVDLVIR